MLIDTGDDRHPVGVRNEDRLRLPLSPDVERRLEAIPPLEAFFRGIRPYVQASDPGRFWACEPLFLDLMASSFLPDLLNHELSLLVDDSEYLTGGVASSSFTVASAPDFALTIRLLNGPPRKSRLVGSVEHSIIGLPAASRSGPLVVERWTQPNPHPNDVLDRTRRLIPRGRSLIPPGGALLCTAGVDVGRFICGGAPVTPVILTSRVLMPLRWEYDPETLLPCRAIAANVTSSRIEFSTRLLAEIGDRDSLPQLRDLIQHHPDHFVRWGALRAIVAIDLGEGARALAMAAAEDPHRHVREAAAAALQKVRATREHRGLVRPRQDRREPHDLHG